MCFSNECVNYRGREVFLDGWCNKVFLNIGISVMLLFTLFMDFKGGM